MIASQAAPEGSLVRPGAIAVYYEHPVWFERLFAEFERRGTAYLRLATESHVFDPAATGPADFGLVFNRMSPSAFKRGHGHAIFYTLQWLAHLEQRGVQVINGERAFRHEISKALQLTLIASLGLAAPRTRVIHRAADAPEASAGLRFPIVVKPNVGGSGAGVVHFDTPGSLAEAAQGGAIDLGFDGVGLVQEFIPARGGHIVRVEVVGGRFLYGIKVHLSGETFDLCPADICRTSTGVELETACPVEAPKAGLKVEGYQPPAEAVAAVERIMGAAGIAVGGIEYVVDDRDGTLYYYDVNALSNFVSDGPNVIGFDPFVPLVDYLEQEVRNGR